MPKKDGDGLRYEIRSLPWELELLQSNCSAHGSDAQRLSAIMGRLYEAE